MTTEELERTWIAANLFDGYPVTINEQWFVDIVKRGADWRMAGVVPAVDSQGTRMQVNPKSISRLWIIEDKNPQ